MTLSMVPLTSVLTQEMGTKDKMAAMVLSDGPAVIRYKRDYCL